MTHQLDKGTFAWPFLRGDISHDEMQIILQSINIVEIKSAREEKYKLIVKAIHSLLILKLSYLLPFIMMKG